jgi:cysteinyl-tRNA synthetase
MSVNIYDTLTRTKKPLKPFQSNKLRIYVCGPTVYDKAHVGHAMSSIVFDVIRRYLEFKGYGVKHVMNYTDVDDKVIRRAQEQGVEPLSLAQRYITEYDQHLHDLGVLPAHVNPRVSQEMDAIIAMVKGLIEKGFAYKIDGDVYFRVARDEAYGKLSGRVVDEMLAGARLEVDERKEDPADFALWKASKPGEPAWDSPWGTGRPGWHIECSAMCLRHLGERIDIHGGGNDLIFPHHENEIAQSESFNGTLFAAHWVHNGMMQMGGEDMSKSTGNVFTIEAFLNEHEPDVLRLLILNSHYRSPLTFNEDVLRQAERGLERLRGGLRPASPSGEASREAVEALEREGERARLGFEKAMDDDFSTPIALSHIFDLVRVINQARDAGIDHEPLEKVQSTLRELTGVLGLRLDVVKTNQREAVPFIDLAVEIRNMLRDEKQWALADRIRDRLAEIGIVLEDGKDGTTWRNS